jgi:hypothetical protein
MRKHLKTWFVLAGSLAMLATAGCTLYGDKSPSIKTTTSAEQDERLSWQMISKQQWTELQPLLAANVVWTLPGKTLSRDDVIPYLKTLSMSDYTIRDLSVKPNGPDMTVAYTMQVSSSGTSQEFSVVSVWQQVKNGQILILRSQLPVNVTAPVTKNGN